MRASNQGRIESITLELQADTGFTPQQFSAGSVDQVFTAKYRQGCLLLEPANVPFYYVDRAKKKLDIRDSCSAPFCEIAKSILAERRSLLGYDRLYTLWQAMRNVAHLKTPVIEVGVLRGG